MAVEEDYAACKRSWSRWTESKNWVSPFVIACSANKTQMFILKDIFPPRANIVNYGIEQWNLNYPCPQSADVIIACNVFHYSPNPVLWFNHCFAACRELWIQDLFCRQRGVHQREFSLSDQGDCIRYGFGGIQVAGIENVFDLAIYKERLKALELYDAGSFREGKAMVNFVARFKGDL